MFVELTDLVSVVSQLGFPCAAFYLVWQFMTKQLESHREETEKMTEAINNNTNVINLLVTKLGVDLDGEK